VYTYSTVEQPPCSVLRSTVTGEVIIELERADASRLYAAGWRPPQEFVVKADDGVTDLWGVMYTPPGLDPSGSYPILDAQYAAPLIATTPRNFHQAYEQGPGLSQAAYAELGFVVITVDGRGTPFRSKTFMDATWGHLNTNGLEDHVAAIRQLADRHAFIDAQRAGIYGISYGGFFTIRAMLEFPDVFRAGIAGAPIAIMPGMYADYHWSAFQGRPTYPDGGEERTAPDEIPTNWTFLDARTQVAKLAGHLFLQIGELDENVLPGQLMRFIDALIRENKDFEMLLLPGRDHYLMREGYIWRRNWDFMIRHLLGLEPPEDPAAIEVAVP
jgi:dipeptidyl aminopeptidase/acylaminoacyl peptidase